MSEPSSACKATALWWVARGVHVVPVTPRLADNGKGKLAPRPYAAWEWSDVSAPMPPGRLTTSAGVEAFWTGSLGQRLIAKLPASFLLAPAGNP